MTDVLSGLLLRELNLPVVWRQISVLPASEMLEAKANYSLS